MANTRFQFKKFRIQQEKAAMKVCTDSCLFGAWAANKIEKLNIESILDVGTGTGLLSLMLAQKSNAIIDAVEIEKSAAEQAKENFQSSAWKDRVQVIEGDVRSSSIPNRYDLIISNPPFFEKHLKSEDTKRNVALHSETLSLEGLILSTRHLLKAGGSFAVLLPYPQNEIFISLADVNHFFLVEQVLVKQTEKHPYFRSMLWFTTEPTVVKRSEILIKKEGKYTDDFIALLKDYYLYL